MLLVGPHSKSQLVLFRHHDQRHGQRQVQRRPHLRCAQKMLIWWLQLTAETSACGQMVPMASRSLRLPRNIATTSQTATLVTSGPPPKAIMNVLHLRGKATTARIISVCGLMISMVLRSLPHLLRIATTFLTVALV